MTWRHRRVFVVVLFWTGSKSCLKSGSIKMMNMTAPLGTVSANSSSCLMTWWTAPSTRPIWLFTQAHVSPKHCLPVTAFPLSQICTSVLHVTVGVTSAVGYYWVNIATWLMMAKPCRWENWSLMQSVQHNCVIVQFRFHFTSDFSYYYYVYWLHPN